MSFYGFVLKVWKGEVTDVFIHIPFPSYVWKTATLLPCPKYLELSSFLQLFCQMFSSEEPLK